MQLCPPFETAARRITFRVIICSEIDRIIAYSKTDDAKVQLCLPFKTAARSTTISTIICSKIDCIIAYSRTDDESKCSLCLPLYVD